MAVQYTDKVNLAADPTFINRVRQSLLAACVNIKSEAVTVAFHRERESFLVGVMNSPDTYKTFVAMSIANDTNVINDATATGTVAITGANAAAQAALITDAHLDTAISSQFNSYFRTPAS